MQKRGLAPKTVTHHSVEAVPIMKYAVAREKSIEIHVKGKNIMPE